MVSVVDGFLYILNDMFLSALEMVMSKKLILLSFSSSIVNFMVGCCVVEYSEYIMYISYSVFINYENVIHIGEISNYMRLQQNVKYLCILKVL